MDVGTAFLEDEKTHHILFRHAIWYLGELHCTTVIQICHCSTISAFAKFSDGWESPKSIWKCEGLITWSYAQLIPFLESAESRSIRLWPIEIFARRSWLQFWGFHGPMRRFSTLLVCSLRWIPSDCFVDWSVPVGSEDIISSTTVGYYAIVPTIGMHLWYTCARPWIRKFAWISRIKESYKLAHFWSPYHSKSRICLRGIIDSAGGQRHSDQGSNEKIGAGDEPCSGWEMVLKMLSRCVLDTPPCSLKEIRTVLWIVITTNLRLKLANLSWLRPTWLASSKPASNLS